MSTGISFTKRTIAISILVAKTLQSLFYCFGLEFINSHYSEEITTPISAIQAAG